MVNYPEMLHVEPNQVCVEVGKTGELIRPFTKPGKVDVACLQPGHSVAGTVGNIDVKN